MKMASLIAFCMSIVLLLQVKGFWGIVRFYALLYFIFVIIIYLLFFRVVIHPTVLLKDRHWIPPDVYKCLLHGLSSTCPTGFEAVRNQNGHCFCRGTTEPQCDHGFSLDPDTCQCSLFTPPSCPTGSAIHPSNALCVGESVPHCACGDAVLPGCKCETERLRQCTSGTLINDGCTCDSSSTEFPRCSSGCILNSRGCTCETGS